MKKLVLLSICGIALVYFSTFLVGYENREISSLGKGDYGKRLCVHGAVESLYSGDEVTIFNLTDKTSVKIVFFEKMSISEEQNITVCGRADYYKGELEIKAHKVIK